MRFLYLILILCPLPLASARPIWQFTIAILVALYGLVFCLRRNPAPDRKLPQIFYLPVGAMLILVAWGGIQVLFGWSAAPEATIRVSMHVLGYTLFFFLVFASIKKSDDVPKMFRLIGSTVTAYCAYGLMVYFSGNDKVLWFDKWASQNALTATFVNRNSFAAYAGIGFTCLLTCIFWLYNQSQIQGASFKAALEDFLNKNIKQATLLILSITIVFTALLLTVSRAGVMSVLAATLFLIGSMYFSLKNRDPHKEKSKSKNLLLPSILFALISIFNLSGNQFLERLDKSPENDDRFEIYSLAIEAAVTGPWQGRGLGAFAEVYAEQKGPQNPPHIRRAHNDYLELLIGAGPAIGIVCFVIFLVLIFRLMWPSTTSVSGRIFSIGAATVCLQLAFHSLLDFSLQMPAVAITLIAILSLTATLLSKDQS